MRIGVNALYLIPAGVGGTEIYLRSLLAALAEVDSENEYLVFVNRETGACLVPSASNFSVRQTPVPARFRPIRLAWEQALLPIEAGRERLDVLFNPGFTAPIFAACAQVTTFHDLQHLRHPENFRWFELPVWRVLLRASATGSSRVIAVSEPTRDDLLHYYNLPPDRIDIIPHGVDEAFFDLARDRRQSTHDPFVLCVSTLHPHKNLERLIEAFAGFRKVHPRHRLVIAGMRGYHTRAVEDAVERFELNGIVMLPGWIPRNELLDLFRRGSAFVYPSEFEGFGMPVLEAMAAGLPTACSDIAPLRYVSGDAAIRFPPHEVDAITLALLKLVEDSELRIRLSVAGRERASQFTWRRTAELTLQALQRSVQPKR